HHGEGSAISHGESFPGTAGYVELARGRTIEHGVAHQHVAALGSFVAGGDGDGAAAEAFAHVVIGLAQQTELHTRNQEGAKALSGASRELAGDHAGNLSSIAAPEYFAAEMSSDGTIGVGDTETMATGAQRVEF